MCCHAGRTSCLLCPACTPAAHRVLHAQPPAAALACCRTGVLNPGYPTDITGHQNWFGGWSYDDASKATFTVHCNDVGGTYPATSCFLWSLEYGSYQVAYGCDPAKKKPVYQQTETTCFNEKVGDQRLGVVCLAAHQGLSAGQLHVYLPALYSTYECAPAAVAWVGTGLPAPVLPLPQRALPAASHLLLIRCHYAHPVAAGRPIPGTLLCQLDALRLGWKQEVLAL
jgi:hypothetical protein